ncbi:MAG: hypothetical protein NT062_34460 [Proteobacteria bacterium]|nr:hypothetical protein [Pseudomonadota bacterium]
MSLSTTTTELVSQGSFDWFLTIAVGGVGAWLFWFEIRNVLRLRGKPTSPTKSDQLFGYAMGFVIALIALFGTARYRGWI